MITRMLRGWQSQEVERGVREGKEGGWIRYNCGEEGAEERAEIDHAIGEINTH